MASHKRLNSVAHSIAHHAVSFLSYLHPHLGKACARNGKECITIDLMREEPCPEKFLDITPVRLSIGALKGTLGKILESEGFSLEDLTSVKMTLYFNTGENTDFYCSICHAILTDLENRSHEDWVDYIGNRVEQSMRDLLIQRHV